MNEVLDRIDYNLTVIEDRLVSEFLKIQRSVDPAGYGELSESLKSQVKNALVKLRDLLDHSGSGHLELTTDYHEVLRARMYVLDRLLERKVPTVCMNLSGRSAFTSRDVSATRGAATATKQITKRVIAEREASNRSFLSFFKGQFGGHKAAHHNIKLDAVDASEHKEVYADGPYAAAQELVELASMTVTYRAIEESEGEEAARTYAKRRARGRASFEPRDPEPTQQVRTPDIARSPEEIRRKLEARPPSAGKGGRASFTAVDLSPVPDRSGDGNEEKEQPSEKSRFDVLELKPRE